MLIVAEWLGMLINKPTIEKRLTGHRCSFFIGYIVAYSIFIKPLR
jgi:hypothetical protein